MKLIERPLPAVFVIYNMQSSYATGLQKRCVLGEMSLCHINVIVVDVHVEVEVNNRKMVSDIMEYDTLICFSISE